MGRYRALVLPFVSSLILSTGALGAEGAANPYAQWSRGPSSKADYFPDRRLAASAGQGRTLSGRGVQPVRWALERPNRRAIAAAQAGGDAGDLQPERRSGCST